MKAEEIINALRSDSVEVPEGHTIIAVMVDGDGHADMGGTARPEVLKAIGVHFIELATRAEIKAQL